jgi:hypothetical protein
LPHLSLRAFSTISGSHSLLSPTKITVDSAMHLWRGRGGGSTVVVVR